MRSEAPSTLVMYRGYWSQRSIASSYLSSSSSACSSLVRRGGASLSRLMLTKCSITSVVPPIETIRSSTPTAPVVLNSSHHDLPWACGSSCAIARLGRRTTARRTQPTNSSFFLSIIGTVLSGRSGLVSRGRRDGVGSLLREVRGAGEFALELAEAFLGAVGVDL